MTYSSTFSKGIQSIFRIVEKSGKEYIYVPQQKDSVKLPWNDETLEKLKPHFTENTKFLIKDENRGRTYSGSELEWWSNMDAKTLIDSWIHGRDMRNERSQIQA